MVRAQKQIEKCEKLGKICKPSTGRCNKPKTPKTKFTQLGGTIEDTNKFTRDELNYKISFEKKINELEFLNLVKKNAIDCELNKLPIQSSTKKNVDSQNNNRGKEGLKCDILDINISDSKLSCLHYKQTNIECYNVKDKKTFTKHTEELSNQYLDEKNDIINILKLIFKQNVISFKLKTLIQKIKHKNKNYTDSLIKFLLSLL